VPLLCAALLPQVRRFEAWDMQQWLWETWRFVKMIFPLLVVGVFLVGVIRVFIQPEWIRAVAGSNTVAANLAGVVFGVFMYFPTLVEVPIAKMFLSLGMHPGPLIAYLMADPELSLQSILITSAIIGKLKAWTYVALVALFSTLAGLAYGAWVDGTPALTLILIVGGFVATLVVALNFIETGEPHADQDPRHRLRQVPAPRTTHARSGGRTGHGRQLRTRARHEGDHGLPDHHHPGAGDRRGSRGLRPHAEQGRDRRLAETGMIAATAVPPAPTFIRSPS
jgi:hypothetical protein